VFTFSRHRVPGAYSGLRAFRQAETCAIFLNAAEGSRTWIKEEEEEKKRELSLYSKFSMILTHPVWKSTLAEQRFPTSQSCGF
jgi:hypothetical protein